MDELEDYLIGVVRGRIQTAERVLGDCREDLGNLGENGLGKVVFSVHARTEGEIPIHISKLQTLKEAVRAGYWHFEKENGRGAVPSEVTVVAELGSSENYKIPEKYWREFVE